MLPGTEDASSPFWAPDGRQVGFGATGKLVKIDVTGGPAITIAANIPNFRGGAWSQENVIVFAPDRNSSLARVSAAGGTPALLTELDKSRNETGHRNPHFLPDGPGILRATGRKGISSQRPSQGIWNICTPVTRARWPKASGMFG